MKYLERDFRAIRSSSSLNSMLHKKLIHSYVSSMSSTAQVGSRTQRVTLSPVTSITSTGARQVDALE